MRRLPIRWRLTIWYATLLAAALIIFGLALYIGLRFRLYDAFDEQVQSEATLALASVRSGGDDLTLDQAAVASLQNDEHLIRLIRPDGSIVFDSSPLVGGAPFDHGLIIAALAGQTHLSSIGIGDGTLRVVTVPVRSGDRVVGILQVGASRSDVDETLATLALALIVMAPLVLLLAVGGGYLLAGRALAPVAAITELAAGIHGENLTDRLDLDLPDDELGRLAHTFDAMLARIDDAFERQRRFTGDAAHELRTPLSLMRSQVDLALARPRDPTEYRTALQELDGDLERLTRLVGLLLMLSRADTERLVLERAPFDLAETIGVVVEQYAAVAGEAGIVLRDESSPARLTGDEDLLVQVLVNLLDNALAHTPSSGQIIVGCRQIGDRVDLWVSDTGRGIAAEHLERIFDRFYRVDAGRARTPGTPGVGLGLSICRAIVEAHAGTITLKSDPQGGVRVEISLPFAD